VKSRGYLLEKTVCSHERPDVCCLDLDRDFDIDTLGALAEPAKA
jgi:hypothetical protein